MNIYGSLRDDIMGRRTGHHFALSRLQVTRIASRRAQIATRNFMIAQAFEVGPKACSTVNVTGDLSYKLGAYRTLHLILN